MNSARKDLELEDMEQAMPDRQRAPLRRHGERTRTIPEQIADHVGNAIINGEYQDGERIREQELATLYNVSRGPVREAIRVLEQRGLVNFFPRRGAYVVGVTLDTIVELFNTRAVLMGLAARDLARRRSAQPLADLQASIAHLRELAVSRSTAERFTRASARIGGLVIANCGNQYLARLLRHQVDYTLWGFIWRDRPLDFFTPSRQQAVVREWQALAAAIATGRDQDAEHAQRLVFFNSRDAAIATLQKTRGAKIDRAQLIKD
jgi:DNA-binding GntR family transcriptional regulator